MAMWVYTREVPTNALTESIITSKYLSALMPEPTEYEGSFEVEAIYYIRELMRPFIVQLNNIHSEDELSAFARTIPYYDGHHYFFDNKEMVLKFILTRLVWDYENEELGVQDNNNSIDPWDIYEYINDRETLRNFFHPPSVVVNVNSNGQISHLPLSREQLYGIMAVYRYLH